MNFKDFRAQARARKPAAPAPAKSEQGEPSITYACGHQRPLSKITGKKCGVCLDKERNLAIHKRKEERAAKASATKVREANERLPDGSSFSVSYDAAAVEWRGRLTIAGGQVFEGQASGVFRLLKVLDAQYREWLAQDAGGKLLSDVGAPMATYYPVWIAAGGHKMPRRS